ncbi:MAG TPA: hypothetical protein VMN36_12070 [Verrucomicrobiales bacterium]|nr:hypothetical protein [Verrucomicrobiales bacterium]
MRKIVRSRRFYFEDGRKESREEESWLATEGRSVTAAGFGVESGSAVEAPLELQTHFQSL